LTLAELCEPLFLYVCRLNRLVRKGGAKDQAAVWHESRSLFAELHERAASQGGLATQFERVELPLMIFVDSVVRESRLPWAARWKGLANERGEHAGDERFFDLLDESLEDKTDAASERLGIYYTCVGLGYRGVWEGQPEFLAEKMKEMKLRLRDAAGADAARMTPEAYDHLRPGKETDVVVRDWVVLIVTVLAVLLASLFATNVYFYRQAAGGLGRSVERIGEAHEQVFGAGGGGQR
jgi:type VI protein secretion system component VasF